MNKMKQIITMNYSIIQKASNALEVLKEVLDAVDAQNPQGARDEFTLDLVEQCSFQEQRVMHVVMASRDERIISRAIELNEQLQKVLAKHDDLLAGRVTMTTTRFDHEEEEEEPEQLVQRCHIERERFFQENKDGSNLSGHMRGISLHSRNGSSSRSGSIDFRD
ncbi:hypothetical protein glysoja_035914 [Glycine soja]|uniref:GAT domain-containing protein n=1 Tax=Glycine soja TaxID=3848 RepID=A0A0B2RHX7_GLYSO|nr:hypothetical protein glysoja_035914 [Glycine soja]